MKSKIFVLGLICLFFISCVTTEAIKIGTTQNRPPVSPEKVIIYRTADQVPGKYEEIAMLTSTGDSTWTTQKQMIESMKKKAGKLGANAIILDAMSEPSAEAKVMSNFLYGGWGGADREGNAVAIFVFEQEKKKIK